MQTVDATTSDAALGDTLLAGANASGGWPYYAGKNSRLEPTAWALLALSNRAADHTAPHAAFLQRLQQPSGWLQESSGLPINVGFNALVAFAWFARPRLANDAARASLLSALVKSKGIKAPNSESGGQDNSLQGWAWIDTTFSWVEPTALGMLALKKARRSGVSSTAADARIDEAERLLLNRTCQTGGWNYGNATALSQDLRAYVPTTALGLLAMQDRRNESSVTRGLDFLETHWRDEPSAPSLGLSLICLDAFGRPAGALEAELRRHLDAARIFGNFHGDAVALCALANRGSENVFRL